MKRWRSCFLPNGCCITEDNCYFISWKLELPLEALGQGLDICMFLPLPSPWTLLRGSWEPNEHEAGRLWGFWSMLCPLWAALIFFFFKTNPIGGKKKFKYKWDFSTCRRLLLQMAEGPALVFWVFWPLVWEWDVRGTRDQFPSKEEWVKNKLEVQRRDLWGEEAKEK